MTNTSQTSFSPTPEQLSYLRALAHRTGTTFTMPNTRRQARRQIDDLLGRPISTQLELALDTVAIRGGEVPETV